MKTSRYDPAQVQPMREELTQLGFEELLTPDAVDRRISDSRGTLLVVVNSVCGCAAAAARPGVRLALGNHATPDHLATVFAGMELDAVDRVRTYLKGYPPTSPQIVLFKDGRVEFVLQRHDLEGRSAAAIATDLRTAFDLCC
jgi:putative YphP/YqiW family bacilliredoxin